MPRKPTAAPAGSASCDDADDSCTAHSLECGEPSRVGKNPNDLVFEFYSALLHVSTPCPDGENGHRRCRAVVGPTSHGVREGREGAARHRIADSTSGEHRAAAAEGASRGENRPFGLSSVNEWLPMPTAMSPMENVRSRAVWTYRSASGLGGSHAERRRSRRHGIKLTVRRLFESRLPA